MSLWIEITLLWPDALLLVVLLHSTPSIAEWEISRMNELSDRKRCFVSMPFGVKEPSGQSIDFDTIFQLIVQPPLVEAGYVVVREDNLSPSIGVYEEITKAVLESELFIGDITFLSPKVMYELGLRHASMRPALIIRRSGEAESIDLRRFRICEYSDNPRDIKLSERRLFDEVMALESAGPQIELPVSEYLATKMLRSRQKEGFSSLSPTEGTAILNVLSGISTRLEGLELRYLTLLLTIANWSSCRTKRRTTSQLLAASSLCTVEAKLRIYCEIKWSRSWNVSNLSQSY